MKKIWYSRDKVGDVLPIRITEKEPELFNERHFISPDYARVFNCKQFKKLFGFTPRRGEKGQLEIKRVKLSKQSGKEPRGGEMNKVTIEINSNGFDVKVFVNGRRYIEQWEVAKGGYKRVEGDFEKDIHISDELYDALNVLELEDVARSLEGRE